MVQKNSVKDKIIIISGPTAVGKSDIAVELALKFNGEIVSADSMQIYRGMDIGTGKITRAEQKGVAHHMLDIVSPNERYSVGRYYQEVLPIIDDIIKRGKLPIIVGGTALYINALINGMNFSDTDKSDEIREKWKAILLEKGNEFVYNELKKIDPVSAEKISPNDTKRVIRAIEIYEATGKPKSEIATVSECKYDYRLFILNDDREVLYNRINDRVEKMFNLGLYNEVLSLLKYSECQSVQAIGYKQIVELVSGAKYNDISEAREDIKKLSRNYAKRQLTFLRGMNATNKAWIDFSQANEIFSQTAEFLGVK